MTRGAWGGLGDCSCLPELDVLAEACAVDCVVLS